MKNTILITAIVATAGVSLLTCNTAKAQDPRFTQFYASPLLVNPAIMGASEDMRFSLAYRNQWGSINSGYSTYDFNGWYPLYMKNQKDKLDIGLSVLDDKAGSFNTVNADLAVDYNKEIAEDQNLCLALFGGYGQQSLNTTNLTYDDQYVLGSYSASNESNENMINKSKGYADVGFGFVWYMNPCRDKSKLNAFLGVSGYHLNQPNTSMDGSTSKLPVRMSYQGGLKLLESNKIDIAPNARVDVQGGSVDIALGAYVDYNFNDDLKLTLGTWYRKNDAIAILVGVEYKGFQLGYSYDAVTSTLIDYKTSLNANEITLSYKLKRKKEDATTPQIGSTTGTTPASATSSTPAPASNPFPEF